MNFPTIFDVFNQLAFLRGLPATYIALVAAVITIVAWDWRLTLLALAVHYLATGLLFVDVLDPRLATVKMLVGLFACLILYITARQVNWGHLPVDVTPEEAARLSRERRVRVGPYLVPATLSFRIFLVLMMVLVVWTVGQQPPYRLPLVPDSLPYLHLAVYGLVGMGLLRLGLTSEPWQAGIGVLVFLSGFELFYGVLEQSVAVLAVLAAVNLSVVLAVAYLTQARHAIQVLLD